MADFQLMRDGERPLRGHILQVFRDNPGCYMSTIRIARDLRQTCVVVRQELRFMETEGLVRVMPWSTPRRLIWKIETPEADTVQP